MSDLINRQKAIDEINKLEYPSSLVDVKRIIVDLPSAQPEIIYCKKCEHWTMTYGDEQWGLGDCDVFDKHLVMCNGYCAWAERRRDG